MNDYQKTTLQAGRVFLGATKLTDILEGLDTLGIDPSTVTIRPNGTLAFEVKVSD